MTDTTSTNGAQPPQRKPWNRCATTARQIRRDLQESYGTELSDDDAGRDNAELMLHYLAHLPHGALKMKNFLELWCPWMPPPEREFMLQEAALSPPPRYTADQLAARLGTTYARRQKLRHTVIGSVDADKAERARLKKERDCENARRRAEDNRRAMGKPTRSQWLAENALSRTLKTEGIARSTYYWRQKKAARKVGQVVTPASLGKASERTCPTMFAERTAAARKTNGKNKGHHRPREGRVSTKRRKPTEQRAVPGIVHSKNSHGSLNQIVHLEAVSLVIFAQALDHDRLTDGPGSREEVRT
jgi:hypothetical protein